MICFKSLETRIIKILNQITYQQIQKPLLITTSIHEIKLEVIPPYDPIAHTFDVKQKLVSGPKQDFSIKVASKSLFTIPKMRVFAKTIDLF
jgi:hypothetical protein